jgi:hypothetical protein
MQWLKSSRQKHAYGAQVIRCDIEPKKLRYMEHEFHL